MDDGEDHWELIRRYLIRTGVSLDIAENGLLGVERFKAESFDIVLMDIEMPVFCRAFLRRPQRNSWAFGSGEFFFSAPECDNDLGLCFPVHANLSLEVIFS